MAFLPLLLVATVYSFTASAISLLAEPCFVCFLLRLYSWFLPGFDTPSFLSHFCKKKKLRAIIYLVPTAEEASPSYAVNKQQWRNKKTAAIAHMPYIFFVVVPCFQFKLAYCKSYDRCHFSCRWQSPFYAVVSKVNSYIVGIQFLYGGGVVYSGAITSRTHLPLQLVK